MFKRILLGIIFVAIIPYIVLAESSDKTKSLQKSINGIDIKLNDKVIERENLLKELNKISNFSTVARSWFSKISKKNAEIKRLKNKSRNDYENNPVNIEIKKQKKELKALRKLNGNI